jgi:hypothetical protein
MTNHRQKYLTKSNYLTGLNCLKSLWYEKHRKNDLPKIDDFVKSIMEQGIGVGELAKEYYKEEGLDIEKIIEEKYGRNNSEFFSKQIELSKESLKKNKILYEATFVFNRLYSRADILKPNEDGSFDIIEVKSGTKPKKENIDDVSFQYYIYTNLNIKIKNSFIMNIDNSYEFKGEKKLDLNKFFYLTDITEKVKEKQKEVEENVELFLEVIDQKEFNNKYHNCVKLKKCKYGELFNEKLNENNLESLTRITDKKLIALKEYGFEKIKDIDISKVKLSEKQKIQIELIQSNKEFYIDKGKIKYMLKDLKYPYYFLDFETISRAIPIYNNSKPYNQITFQFSLHIKKDKNSELEHFEFLETTNKEPRINFIEKILEYIKEDNGSIIVYFEGFENARLKEIKNIFPKYTKQIDNLLGRVFDLHKIFSNFYYYNIKQMGSTSIKKTLTVLNPEFSYKNLEIQNGGMATSEFYRLISTNMKKEEKDKLIIDLLKYCELDTLAMVKILEKIEKLI